MVYCCIFMDYFDVMFFEMIDVFFWFVISGFDDFDVVFDDCLMIFGIRWWFDCW